MKCVATKGQTSVIRVTDARAEQMVKSGHWHYVPKSVWKKSGRKTG